MSKLNFSRFSHLYYRHSAFGSLTVRSLLDMREHCLNEVDFPDPYLQVFDKNNKRVYR